jgi:hypothetical protein
MALIKPNLSHIKKIRQIKKFSRDRDLRIKLELFEDVFMLQNVTEACKLMLSKNQSYLRQFYNSNHTFHDFRKKKESRRGIWPFHIPMYWRGALTFLDF